ncbi:MAG: haloacid dehalogenase [Chloroflexota bacterium]|nr:haloacid dehalogenase [Chloroflexota bacterium]
MDNLDTIVERIRTDLEAKNAARDEVLRRSRALIRDCSRAIRATHRGEFEAAADLLAAARSAAEEMIGGVRQYPDLYYAGYTQDALKEFAEANITYALITDSSLPDPVELGVEDAAYLNGLGEAVGEMRRYVLDIIRHGRTERAERILHAMDDIYGVLVTIDFPNALTSGLRRTTDMVRGVLERTRGDLTMAMRQERLSAALKEAEVKLNHGQTE